MRRDGGKRIPWQTSWGLTTRSIGVMARGRAAMTRGGGGGAAATRRRRGADVVAPR